MDPQMRPARGASMGATIHRIQGIAAGDLNHSLAQSGIKFEEGVEEGFASRTYDLMIFHRSSPRRMSHRASLRFGHRRPTTFLWSGRRFGLVRLYLTARDLVPATGCGRKPRARNFREQRRVTIICVLIRPITNIN